MELPELFFACRGNLESDLMIIRKYNFKSRKGCTMLYVGEHYKSCAEIVVQNRYLYMIGVRTPSTRTNMVGDRKQRSIRIQTNKLLIVYVLVSYSD